MENWDKSKERFTAFWQGEMFDRASVYIKYLKPNAPKREFSQVSVEERYTNAKLIVERKLAEFEDSVYAADGFAEVNVSFAAAGHCCYTKNPKFQYTDETVWVFPGISELNPDSIVFNEDNPVFLHHLEMHKYLAKHANGRYMVGNIDNTGNLDALAHLRGSGELLMDMYDNPEVVKLCRDKLHEIQKFTTDKFMETYAGNNPGTVVPWMGLWCPERMVQAQVDISVMMSPEMFEEFGLPELEAHSKWPGKVVYHLDGQEQINHLDMLLACESIDAIQWTPVAGQPKTSEFLPVLQKIQKAGKSLVLFPNFDEIDILTRELSHKGLHMALWCVGNEEQANEAMKIVEKNAHE